MGTIMRYGSGGAMYDPGAKFELLWENDTPGSAFAAQTIAVDLSGYAEVMVIPIFSKSTQNPSPVVIAPVIDGTVLTLLVGSGTYNNVGSRTATIDLSTPGLVFAGGRYGGSNNNDYVIPMYIYGIRNGGGSGGVAGGGGSGAVSSVNGMTGAVILDAAAVSALPDTTLYAASPSAGGPATLANGIHYATVDGTSTSTAFTASVSGITSYYDGLTVLLKNGVVTSAAGFTIDINSLGAKPVYNNMAAATAESTIFNINYTMLFVYDSTRVAGGCWICYRGYNSDTNTIGYQLRTNSRTKPAADAFVRYRLLFTSADGEKYVPANTSTSTSATSNKTTNTRAIDPWGEIVYYGSTTAISAGSSPGTGVQWEQYALNLGYSFYPSGAGMTSGKPVFLKCTPQTDGSAVMDSIVQALPSSADGKIYIYLGTAYSATNIELVPHHPVYHYSNGAIRLWTNAAVVATDDGNGNVTISLA